MSDDDDYYYYEDEDGDLFWYEDANLGYVVRAALDLPPIASASHKADMCNCTGRTRRSRHPFSDPRRRSLP